MDKGRSGRDGGRVEGMKGGVEVMGEEWKGWEKSGRDEGRSERDE